MKYIGIDEFGKRYEVQNIDWENMTAWCEVEGWIGTTKCRFERFEEVINTNAND